MLVSAHIPMRTLGTVERVKFGKDTGRETSVELLNIQANERVLSERLSKAQAKNTYANVHLVGGRVVTVGGANYQRLMFELVS